jgi:multidrug transporter EmrE-like cation transporter
VAVGAALYAASILIRLVIAIRLALSFAYPVAVGLSLIAITAGAVVWLGETVTLSRAIGSILIIGGIALVVR